MKRLIAVKAKKLDKGNAIFKPTYSCEGCVGNVSDEKCLEVSDRAEATAMIYCGKGYIYKEVE